MLEDELWTRSVGQTVVAMLLSIVGAEEAYNLHLRNKKEKKMNQRKNESMSGSINNRSERPVTPSDTRIPLIERVNDVDSNPDSIQTVSEVEIPFQSGGRRERLLECFASCLGLSVSVQCQ